MPFTDAKFPPRPTTRDAEHVRTLLAALEPFAFLLENPLDYPDEWGTWRVETVALQEARLVFCRVATAIGLPGFGGEDA